jgi:hypothetical protein
MSEDAGEKNKRAGKEEALPTTSFDDSAPVVVHCTGGSIRPFDFLSINGYSIGVFGERG